MFKKNTAVTGFPFGLVSATDGSAITTGTVTGYYTLDGGTQGTISGTPVHEGNGQWSVNLLQAEMNGDLVGLLFTHTSAIPVSFSIKTDTKLVSELNDVSTAEVNTQCDTAITDAALATAANLATVDTVVDGIQTDLDNATDGLGAIKTAVDTKASQTSVDTIDGIVDAILVDTGTTIPGTIATVDSNVDAILLDTGTDGVVISAATANAIADALLKRDFNSVSGESARSALNALRFLRNKWSVSGTTLTVTKEDDSTSAWTSTLTTDGTADPVTASDPA